MCFYWQGSRKARKVYMQKGLISSVLEELEGTPGVAFVFQGNQVISCGKFFHTKANLKFINDFSFNFQIIANNIMERDFDSLGYRCFKLNAEVVGRWIGEKFCRLDGFHHSGHGKSIMTLSQRKLGEQRHKSREYYGFGQSHNVSIRTKLPLRCK